MKRKYRPAALILGLWLLATLSSACQPPSGLSPPDFTDWKANAYVGVDDEGNAQVELDNPLVWSFENVNEKETEYYAFRVTLGALDPANYRFFWLHASETGQGASIPRVNGPSCPATSQEMTSMQEQSRMFTGLDTGPAAYSPEVAKILAESGAVYWEETCELEPLPPRDDKERYQKRFTFLLLSGKVPGRLQAQIWQGRIAPFQLHSPLRDSIPMVHSPFYMAAIGDSLMWGQGLTETAKLPFLVAKTIRQETGKVVRPQNFAFSGATVDFPSVNGDNCWSVEDERGDSGEVPHGIPDIRCQFERIAGFGGGIAPVGPLPLERLDLLLMDGCGNDVDVSDIAFGVEDASTAESLSQQILCHCGEGEQGPDSTCTRESGEIDQGWGMGKLVQEARSKAPNAKIVLLGYFPLLSTMSTDTCFVAGARAEEGLVFLYAARLGLVLPLSVEGFLQGAEERSQQWVQESDQILTRAVDKANQDRSGFGVGSATFVPVPNFTGHEAFVPGGESWLWDVDCFLEPLDPVRGARKDACDAWDWGINDPELRHWLCIRASAFHPNERGEAEYRGTVLDELRRLGVLPTPNAPLNPLAGTNWHVTSLADPATGNMEDVLQDTTLTMNCNFGDLRVDGSSGCNDYSGTYQVSDNQLNITLWEDIIQIQCLNPQGIMDQESAFLALVPQVAGFTIEGATLSLQDDSGQLLMDMEHQ